MNGLADRAQRLTSKLKARTKSDGSAKTGYEQNVAVIRAELEQISELMNNGQ